MHLKRDRQLEFKAFYQILRSYRTLTFHISNKAMIAHTRDTMRDVRKIIKVDNNAVTGIALFMHPHKYLYQTTCINSL